MTTRFRPGDRVRIRPVTGWSFDGSLGTVESVDRRTVFVRPDGQPYSVECTAHELERASAEPAAGTLEADAEVQQIAMEV